MNKDHPLKPVCEALGASRSTFYYKPKPRDDRELRAAIRRVLKTYPKYRHRRVAAELQRRGWSVGRKRILRVMREMGLADRRRAAKVHTTNSDHSFPRYPNLLEGMEISRPDQVWVADITYLQLSHEDLYLAIVMDVYTRGMRGWSLSRGLDTSLTLEALRKALRRGRPEIHHSDQGVQYAANQYVAALGKDVRVSMAQVGQAWRNGHAERVIRTIKEECVDMEDYADLADARRRIGRFLVDVYNRKRIHSALGYLTPQEFERAYESAQRDLTSKSAGPIIPVAGETEAGSAEEQPARDSRLGKRREVVREDIHIRASSPPLLVDDPHASENLLSNSSARFGV